MRPTARRATVATAALALAGTALLTSPMQAQASIWTATRTQAVHLAGTRLGATAADQKLHLVLSLTPRNAAAMKAAVQQTYTRPGEHHFLTAAQWRARYAPTTATVDSVTSYLRKAGMTHVDVAPNRLEIAVEATAGEAERAFHTSLASYRLHGLTVYGNTSAAQVPSALHSAVTAVLGLNDVPLDAVHTQVVHPSADASKPNAAGPLSTGGLFPGQFRTTYDANKTKPGAKTSIAILTEGKTAPVISSLRIAEKEEHAKRVPVTVVPSGVQSPDTAGADEFDMDTQASSIMATSVKHMYLYSIGALTDSQLDFGFDKYISDDKAQAMSASIGGCEYLSFLDGSELTLDVAMQEAALQGQSLFASSGDEGDACAMVANTGTPAGVPQDEWPAVGAFTTAVGGTSLLSDKDGNRIQELAWLGGGGGDSEFENPGYWTEDTDPGYDSEFASGGRAVPDVALDADPNAATPVKVYVGKTISFVGGTSLSSPLMLGIWARLESAHQNNLGLASIALYDVYDAINPGTTTSVMGIPVTVPEVNPKPVKGFTDITLGSNGLYQATPGWDYTTGLGAPDVAQLVKTIKTHSTKVTPGVATYRVTKRGGGPGKQKLKVTVHLTGISSSQPPTGKVTIHVKTGPTCTATLAQDAASCTLLISRATHHTLTVSYPGDSHYNAVRRTFVTVTDRG